MRVEKKYKIAVQALILGYVIVTDFLLCGYWDKKTAEEQRMPKSTGVVAATCDIDSSNDRVTYLEIAEYGNSPLYENIEEEYIYCPEKETTAESMALPIGDCSNMMYMDYRTLTNTASAQYELQQYAWTDSQGFRRYGNYYIVAMGTYYGYVGDTFRITTDRGNCYDVILGDCKGNDAVGYDGYYSWYHVAGDYRLNVVEFIVDTYCLDGYALTMGDCGVLDNIGGNVIKIEKIV